MEDDHRFTQYLDALDSLLEASAGPGMHVESHGTYRRHFKEGDEYYWVLPTTHGFRRLPVEKLVARLDARWSLVEIVFGSFVELQPHIRAKGSDSEPRPVQAWEWSCVGLHQLWTAWGKRSEHIQADLRPALLDDADTREFECVDLHEFELFFTLKRVEGLAKELREQRRKRDRWQALLMACVEKHDLGPKATPFTLLGKLRDEGVAQKRGQEILFNLEDGERAVKIQTFQRIARLALKGELEL